MILRASSLCVLLISLFSLHLVSGSDFKCFQCSSDRDDWCKNPLSEGREPTECDSVEHQAKIIFQKTKNVFKDLFQSIISQGAAPNDQNFHYACMKEISMVSGVRVIRRKCTLDTSDVRDDNGKPLDDECTTKSTYTSFCGICKTDSCNSASNFNFLGQFLVLVGSLLLKFLW
ncbi:uncharacterized protein LOC132197838 [Neocloeon triangulifer]|uniref:uncharacterized protein LOC132197838 n=1 Tax=Neocloeon triangulifer TaxID=2078957 RepID=UPI00286EFCA8|nr:uncharacterized protein LOC132197838 [Neocloeon triangulifer]